MEPLTGETATLTLIRLAPDPAPERVARLLAQVFRHQSPSSARRALEALPLTLTAHISLEDAHLLSRHLEARGAEVRLEAGAAPEPIHAPAYQGLSAEAVGALGTLEDVMGAGAPEPEEDDGGMSWGDPAEGDGPEFSLGEGADWAAEAEPDFSLGDGADWAAEAEPDFSLGDGADWDAEAAGEDAPSWDLGDLESGLGSLGGNLPGAPGVSFASLTQREKEAAKPPAIQVASPAVPEVQATTVLKDAPAQRREEGPRGVAPSKAPEAPWEAPEEGDAAPWEADEATLRRGFGRLFKDLLKR